MLQSWLKATYVERATSAAFIWRCSAENHGHCIGGASAGEQTAFKSSEEVPAKGETRVTKV